MNSFSYDQHNIFLHYKRDFLLHNIFLIQNEEEENKKNWKYSILLLNNGYGYERSERKKTAHRIKSGRISEKMRKCVKFYSKKKGNGGGKWRKWNFEKEFFSFCLSTMTIYWASLFCWMPCCTEWRTRKKKTFFKRQMLSFLFHSTFNSFLLCCMLLLHISDIWNDSFRSVYEKYRKRIYKIILQIPIEKENIFSILLGNKKKSEKNKVEHKKKNQFLKCLVVFNHVFLDMNSKCLLLNLTFCVCVNWFQSLTGWRKEFSWQYASIWFNGIALFSNDGKRWEKSFYIQFCVCIHERRTEHVWRLQGRKYDFNVWN